MLPALDSNILWFQDSSFKASLDFLQQGLNQDLFHSTQALTHPIWWRLRSPCALIFRCDKFLTFYCAFYQANFWQHDLQASQPNSWLRIAVALSAKHTAGIVACGWGLGVGGRVDKKPSSSRTHTRCWCVDCAFYSGCKSVPTVEMSHRGSSHLLPDLLKPAWNYETRKLYFHLVFVFPSIAKELYVFRGTLHFQWLTVGYIVHILHIASG